MAAIEDTIEIEDDIFIVSEVLENLIDCVTEAQATKAISYLIAEVYSKDYKIGGGKEDNSNAEIELKALS